MKRSSKAEQVRLWTLPELCELVAAALDKSGYQGPANGQVRAVPTARSIRYYSTTGLLDPPARMEGRTALYSQRHLLQLVAIKRLQAQDLPLAAVQQQLYGMDDERLAVLAALPPLLELQAVLDAPAPAAAASPPSERRDTAFWAAAPSPLPAPPDAGDADDADYKGDADEPVHGVQLDPRVLLVLRGGPTPSARERHQLRELAAPLLAWLKARRS